MDFVRQLIFGSDIPTEMTFITDELAYPAILKLQISDKDGEKYVCTGFVIDKDIVMTASHCIHFDIKDIVFPDHDDFYVVKMIVNESFQIKRMHISEGIPESDFAFLIVARIDQKSISDVTGIMDFTTDFQLGDHVRTIGFPTLFSGMTSISGKITQVSDQILKTSNIASCGNSGGPLLNHENKVISVVSCGNLYYTSYPILLNNWEFIHLFSYTKQLARDMWYQGIKIYNDSRIPNYIKKQIAFIEENQESITSHDLEQFHKEAVILYYY